MKKSLGAIVLLLVVVTLAYGQNQKATNRGAPGQVPLGGMIAVMPTMHANAWQPPATGAIKDGFMRADGATVSAQNVTDGSQFPAGTVLPNMVSAFPRGATTSAVAATGSDTRDISHTHAMAHNHDTSIAHTHGYGFAHTHGTDSQLSTLNLAHQHNYKHAHQWAYVSNISSTYSWVTVATLDNTMGSWTDILVGFLPDTYKISASNTSSNSITGGYSRAWLNYSVPVGTSYYTSGVLAGVSGDGASALTDPQLGSNNLAHSHTTNSQSATSGTTSSQSATTFTSGAASNATTTSGGSASLDIKPAYLNTVWVIRVK